MTKLNFFKVCIVCAAFKLSSSLTLALDHETIRIDRPVRFENGSANSLNTMTTSNEPKKRASKRDEQIKKRQEWPRYSIDVEPNTTNLNLNKKNNNVAQAKMPRNSIDEETLIKNKLEELSKSEFLYNDDQNHTLNKDIETINALITMLVVANKRLMEIKVSKNNSRDPQEAKIQRVDPQLLTLNEGTHNVTKRKTKRTQKYKKFNDTDRASHSKFTRPVDHNSVKPGFLDEDYDKTNLKSSSSNDEPIRRISKDALRKNAPYATMHNFINEPSTHQHHLPRLRAPYPSYGSEIDERFVNYHRPLVAHDLLHTSRPILTDIEDRQQEPMKSPVSLLQKTPLYYDQLYHHHNQHPPPAMFLGRPPPPPLHIPPHYNHLNAIGHEELNPTPVWPQHPPPPAQSHQQTIDNGLIGPGNSNQLFHPMSSPLQHMLEVSKNQQAAKMAHDQRRQEHEKLIERQKQQAKAQLEAAKKNIEAEQEQAKPELAGGENVEKGQDFSGDGKNVNDESNTNSDEESSNDEHNSNDEGGDQSSNVEDDGGGPGEKQQTDDADMKGFTNFADNTDLTELFPPGILSDNEIKEIKQQQEEQRRQEEEEKHPQEEQEDTNTDRLNNTEQDAVSQTQQNNNEQQESNQTSGLQTQNQLPNLERINQTFVNESSNHSADIKPNNSQGKAKEAKEIMSRYKMQKMSPSSHFNVNREPKLLEKNHTLMEPTSKSGFLESESELSNPKAKSRIVPMKGMKGLESLIAEERNNNLFFTPGFESIVESHMLHQTLHPNLKTYASKK